jgi:hypothetical protein
MSDTGRGGGSSRRLVNRRLFLRLGLGLLLGFRGGLGLRFGLGRLLGLENFSALDGFLRWRSRAFIPSPGQHFRYRNPIDVPDLPRLVRGGEQAFREIFTYLFRRIRPELYACQPDMDFHHNIPGRSTGRVGASVLESGLVEVIFGQS